MHIIPVFASFVDKFAFEGDWNQMRPAMTINNIILPSTDSKHWLLGPLQAGLRSWWLVEYGGYFETEPPEGVLDSKINIDEGAHGC